MRQEKKNAKFRSTCDEHLPEPSTGSLRKEFNKSGIVSHF